MKDKLTILLIILTFASFGQSNSDTLFFANKKYPLIRTKTFLNGYSNPIDLPSEYVQIKSEISFQYNTYNDSTYHISYDDQGNQFTVIVAGDNRCTSRRNEKTIYYLTSVVDTIKIKAKDLGVQKPYIKTKSKKVFFCSSKVEVIYNDTIKSFHHDPILDGKVFSYWDDNYRNYEINYDLRKSAIYILRDLYYRKGDATYYFDRTFVIMLY